MLKQRTIIEFGVPGEPASIVYHVEGSSIIIEEIAENPNNIKVGENVGNRNITCTGREIELSFKSPEAATDFLERAMIIAKKLLYEDKVSELRKAFSK